MIVVAWTRYSGETESRSPSHRQKVSCLQAAPLYRIIFTPRGHAGSGSFAGATVAVRERVGIRGQQVPLEVLDEREVRVGAPKLQQLRRLAADENVIFPQITLIHTEKP